MYRDDPGSRPQALPLGIGRRAWSAHWWLAWLIALLAAGLATGVSFAATDPDWAGTEPENISNSPPNKAWQPVIVASPSGRMVVVWSDQESVGAPRNIYARRSDDNGQTWSASEVISGTAYESALPDALVVGGQDFVAWVDQRTVGGQNVAIYEAEIGAGGARRVLSPIPLSSTRPRLAASAGGLHVAFNAGAHILHAARPLTATAWPTATCIYTSTAAFGPWFPMLAIGPDGETLHVVWQEVDLGEWAIMYVRGEVDGADVDWEPARTLSTESTELIHPAIAADASGNLHVVWGEVVGTGALEDRDQYVRYTRYDVAGDQWISPAIRIDDNPVRVNRHNPTYTAPRLALLEKDNQVTVCVAWHGFRAGDPEAEEVLLSCSQDGGDSWSSPQNVSRSSDDGWAISIEPSITFGALGQLRAAWQERAGDDVVENYEIYYTRALNKAFLPLVARNWR